MPALVCPLGPNPASFTEALWALARAGETVSAAWVLPESEEAAQWFDLELRMPGGPLDQLRAVEPDRLGGLHLVQMAPTGQDSLAFARVVFSAVKAAQGEHDAVVLTLSGGRWRGSVAAATLIFQLLARPADSLVDVRVDLRAAEGGSGFFFPGQRRQELDGRLGRPFRAADVGVSLVPVVAPRLRPLLREDAVQSYDLAVQAGQEALAQLGPPTLRLDLSAGLAMVGERRLALGPAYFPYAAWVWVARGAGRAGVRAGDVAGFRAFLMAWQRAEGPTGALARRRAGSLADKLLRPDGDAVTWDDLKAQVSRARSEVAAAVSRVHPRSDLVAPAVTHLGESSAGFTVHGVEHRVALAPDRILLEGEIQSLDWPA